MNELNEAESKVLILLVSAPILCYYFSCSLTSSHDFSCCIHYREVSQINCCCVLGRSQSTWATIRNMSSINHFDTLRWELPSNMLSLQGPSFLSYALLLIYNIYTREETHYQRKGTRSSNFFSFPQHSQPKKKLKLCKILKITIPCKYFAHTHS